MTGIIYGTGACTPSYIMDNNDIAKLVETSDEWIPDDAHHVAFGHDIPH